MSRSSSAVVSLAYDGFGVAILGFAFFSKSLEALMMESGTYFGGNDAVLESFIQSRTDGVAGTLLLIAGFVFQWLSSVGITSDVVGKILFAVLTVILLLYVVFLRTKLISLQVSAGDTLRTEMLD